jgi:hypothetical protein
MVLRLQPVACSLALVGLVLPFCSLAKTKNDARNLSPAELVRQAANNEVAANSESGRHFMFKDQKQTTHLTQVKLLVETKDATAGMLVSQDGHPLNAQQREQEEARLANYVRNPEELNKKRKQEKEDAEHSQRILKALPDAFLYEPDGTERGTDTVGHVGDELVRLKFRPNPTYDPPSRVEQVLTGMEGHLLIDATAKRVAEIDATLQKDVGFGWGILGHLDRGGRFLVQQADVGDKQWEVTRMELLFTGKILFVKKLSIRSSDIFSDFHPVPSDLTFAQGVELLKKEATQVDAGAALKQPKTARVPVKSDPKDEPKTEAERQRQLCCDR